MPREIPHALYDIMSHIPVRSLVVVLKEWAMKSGWITRPTRRSETARLHSKSMAGERSEGALKMAANTKLFPTMATSIEGTFMALVIMSERVSSPDVFCERLKESINKLFSVMFRMCFIFIRQRRAVTQTFNSQNVLALPLTKNSTFQDWFLPKVIITFRNIL